ncbi:MAG: polyprenyl synthetase family protein [Dehalococcoidia bacterium]
MIATAEQEVSSLQARFLPEVRECLRSVVPDSDSGFFGLLRFHLGWEDAAGNPANEDSGKSLRPVLCLAACDMAGGDWQAAMPAAAALELVHNFSLIHDDIQDGDTTRRGRATLWTVRGIPAAVAAGNAMRVVADQTLAALADTGMRPSLAVLASVELTHRYLEMIEGQYMDMSFEQAEHVTVDEYLDMIGRKTGALIESALFLGALAGSGDPDAARSFGRCGRKLGLAFQVRDDYLGVWGNPKATGKAVGADIRRKKKALPVLYMLEQATPADMQWITPALSEPEVSEANVERVLDLLDRLDARKYVQSVAEAQAEEALAAVSELSLPPGAEQKLNAMAKFFVTRQK